MTDIQAALGLSQLTRLRSIVEERNRLLRRYQELLSSLPVDLLVIPNETYSAVHLAVIKLKGDDAVVHRKVFEHLRAQSIGVQVHYTPVHLQPYYSRLGFKPGDFPAAEAYGRSAISLPLFPGLTDDEQLRVVKALEAVL